MVDKRDWLFLVETVFLYGGIILFGSWQVWKMRRDVREIRAKRAQEEAAKSADSEAPQ